MRQFSDRNLEVIQAFCCGMQMPMASLSADGSITFDIETLGTLSLTPSRDGKRALISLKRRLQFPQIEDLKRFMTLPQWNPYLALPISAGMSADGGLLLVAAMDEPSVTLQTLEQCVAELIKLHDTWAADHF